MLNAACAQKFPRPDTHSPTQSSDSSSQLSAQDIFEQTFSRHGGANLGKLSDLNISIDGDWKFLITRIQPLVTDHKYRVTSQERILLKQKVYAASFDGPAGNKQVFFSPQQTRVFYNGEASNDEDVLRSTALTANSFYFFSLGPLALADMAKDFIRLTDKEENGRRYHRLYTELTPGIGRSERDELVLWVDAESHLSYRIHITLEGFKTTQGAHVGVTFKNFTQVEDFTFPSVFRERVLGPIAIDAHDWHLTGIDINRGLERIDISEQSWSPKARREAKPLSAQE